MADKLLYFAVCSDKWLLEIFLNSAGEKLVFMIFQKQVYFWPLENPRKSFQLENGEVLPLLETPV